MIMITSRKFLFAALIIYLGSLSTAIAQELEPIHGISVDRKNIIVKVTSNGCTQSEDFRVIVNVSKLGTVMEIYRDKQDQCKMTPQKVDLAFDRILSGLPDKAPFVVSNFFVSSNY